MFGGTPQPAREARARMRAVGLRSTAARAAVLAHLDASDAPVSHGELCAALAPLGFDRATLHRNLVDLAGAGLVDRVDLGDRVWRYEVRRRGAGRGGERAARFVCTDCGTISRLDVRLSVRGADVRVDELLLRGRCLRCA